MFDLQYLYTVLLQEQTASAIWTTLPSVVWMGKHTPMNVMPGVMVVEWPFNAQALAHVKVSICL
jgi:hypothetical protein